MKQNIIISIGLLTGACIISQSNAIAQDEIPNLKKPSSWNQYLDSVVESGDLGTWRYSGVTKDLWAGIPAGIRYVGNDTIDISHDKKKLLIAGEMIAEDGKMLSIGSGFVGWDPVAKRIYSFFSGYDGGKPFWGPRELVGFSSEGEVWKYTETSRGDTYETQIVSKRTSKTSRTNIIKKTDGTGEVFEVNLRKVISADIAETEVEKSILRTKDEISKKVIKYFDSAFDGDLKYAESFYADDVEVMINKIKVSGKKAYIERLTKIQKVLFKDMKFLDLHVHTNYFSDEALASNGKTFGDLRSKTIWSNAWAELQAVGRITKKNVTFPIHCDFRWENGKVVEMLAYYDPTVMNDEIAALEVSGK